VKDTGIRNEDGLEELSNFFSPTPSARHTSIPTEDDYGSPDEAERTMAESKSMDIVTSEFPAHSLIPIFYQLG
jgi:hypothetical protein